MSYRGISERDVKFYGGGNYNDLDQFLNSVNIYPIKGDTYKKVTVTANNSVALVTSSLSISGNMTAYFNPLLNINYNGHIVVATAPSIPFTNGNASFSTASLLDSSGLYANLVDVWDISNNQPVEITVDGIGRTVYGLLQSTFGSISNGVGVQDVTPGNENIQISFVYLTNVGNQVTLNEAVIKNDMEIGFAYKYAFSVRNKPFVSSLELNSYDLAAGPQMAVKRLVVTDNVVFGNSENHIDLWDDNNNVTYGLTLLYKSANYPTSTGGAINGIGSIFRDGTSGAGIWVDSNLSIFGVASDFTNGNNMYLSSRMYNSEDDVFLAGSYGNGNVIEIRFPI